MPRDPRLVRLALALQADPADDTTLDDWAARIGLSRSTLVRRFQAETGLAFGVWRQQLRLFQALELLSQGQPVTATALTVGYASVSAFIEAFRRQFGQTPGRFVAGAAASGE